MPTSPNPHISRIVANAHERIIPILERRPSDQFMIENLLIAMMVHTPDIDIMSLRVSLYKKKNIDINRDETITVLKRCAIFKDRAKIFSWIQNIAKHFIHAMEGDFDSFTYFTKYQNELPVPHIRTRPKERMLLLAIFSLLDGPEAKNIFEHLLKSGNWDAVICLNKLIDITAFENEFVAIRRKSERRIQSPRRDMTMGQALHRIEELEAKLEKMSDTVAQMEAARDRVDAMLKDLQDDFDEQLDESRVQALTDFFSRLNSDRYGRILDEAFSLRKGINSLRKENYRLPEAINGLMIMVLKLLQFIKDSHIDPLMKLGEIREVQARDIESCEYDGSPFADENEVKSVRIVSPGWIFKEKDILISRPMIREHNKEEQAEK